MLPLGIFVLVAFGAFAIAGYAWIAERRRRLPVGSTLGAALVGDVARHVLLGGEPRVRAAVRTWLSRWPPARWIRDSASRERLLWAGFDDEDAPLAYAALRLATLIGVPAVVTVIAEGRPIAGVVVDLVVAAGVAWLAPIAVLEVTVRRRQERIRRAIADGIDLLLVSVEAGCSVESAIQHVARTIRLSHPDLAKELTLVVRKTRSGIARAEALRGLYTRTGVDELRLIGASVVGSERWGTSVVKTLRATAATLRRKRARTAERRAWMAPIKMAIVLVTLILPAIVLILLGPTLLRLGVPH